MDKQFAYQKIYNDLLEDIRSGQLSPGTVLPAETQIAQNYRVSRITSRRALIQLAEDGYISRRAGKGSVVLPPREEVKTIGLAIANMDAVFGMDFVKGVLQEAREQGFLVICQIGYFLSSHEQQCIQDMVKAGVQGIINIPLYEAKRSRDSFLELTKHTPVVFADRQITGLEVPLVCTDHMHATDMLCEQLYGHGHRKIAFISSSTGSTAVAQRFKGYQMFCERSGVCGGHPIAFTNVRSVLPGMGHPNVRQRDISEIVAFLQDNQDITAVVAHTYQVGKLVCEAIRQLGCQIPRDYSVVCFDAPGHMNEAEWFTHIRQNEYQIGVEAVRCLKQLIDGKTVPPVTWVKGEYVQGHSCADVKR